MTDLLLSNELDPIVVDGDWAFGSSDEQHIGLLLLSSLGDWRSSPTTGVGLSRYINSRTPGAMLPDIRTQIEADGGVVDTLTVSSTGELSITARYE